MAGMESDPKVLSLDQRNVSNHVGLWLRSHWNNIMMFVGSRINDIKGYSGNE